MNSQSNWPPMGVWRVQDSVFNSALFIPGGTTPTAVSAGQEPVSCACAWKTEANTRKSFTSVATRALRWMRL